MTTKNYVKKITKNVVCGSKRKKDIYKQLVGEIDERIANGEKIENIIEDMGSPMEIAESFNENLSDVDKAKYKTERTINIVGSIVAVFIALTVLAMMFIPKTSNLNESEIFNQAIVNQAVKTTISQFDNNDFDAMRNSSVKVMADAIKDDEMQALKTNLCTDWGNQVSAGIIYSSEVKQSGQYYVTSQVTVIYENVHVVYTITYDQDMKLAGFFIK